MTPHLSNLRRIALTLHGQDAEDVIAAALCFEALIAAANGLNLRPCNNPDCSQPKCVTARAMVAALAACEPETKE